MNGARYLRRLVTLPGAHTYAQSELAADFHARVAALPGAGEVARMIGFVFEHSAIRQRHLEVEPPRAAARRDWYRLVNEATESLAARALRQLFADGAAAEECDGLVVVSSSWAGFPGLGRRLQQAFGFPEEALVYELAALGCAGPTQGLQLADTLVAQGACRAVCVVCADAMGTHGQCRTHRSAPDLAQVVAHCLASDGAAAVVLAATPGPASLFSFRAARLSTRLWPDSLDLNDFTADSDNEPYISVGKDIRRRLTEEIARVLDDDALAAPLFLHPGGAALMRLVGERWPSLRDSAAVSMAILAENGNVGAASVLFVLDRALRAGMPFAPRFRLFALGPGIVTSVLLVDGVEALS